MKTALKILLSGAVLLFTACLCSCSGGSESNLAIIGGADGPEAIIVEPGSAPASEPSSENGTETGNEIIVSEKEAAEIAHSALLEENPPCIGSLEFSECTLHTKADEYVWAYLTERNKPVWAVSYFDTNSVCDYYYYIIDAQTGELIFNAMMGD